MPVSRRDRRSRAGSGYAGRGPLRGPSTGYASDPNLFKPTGQTSDHVLGPHGGGEVDGGEGTPTPTDGGAPRGAASLTRGTVLSPDADGESFADREQHRLEVLRRPDVQ